MEWCFTGGVCLSAFAIWFWWLLKGEVPVVPWINTMIPLSCLSPQSGWLVCRFVCVCVPLKHNQLTNRRIMICIVSMYFASIVANWGTPLVGKSIFQKAEFWIFCLFVVCNRILASSVDTVAGRIQLYIHVCEIMWAPFYEGSEMVDGKCQTKLQRGNIYFIFAASAFTLFYAVPSIALTIFYGMVVYSLRKRVNETDRLGSSSVIEKASIQVGTTLKFLSIL